MLTLAALPSPSRGGFFSSPTSCTFDSCRIHVLLDETRRLALARSLARRLFLCTLEELRLLDVLVTSIEMDREANAGIAPIADFDQRVLAAARRMREVDERVDELLAGEVDG